MSVASGEGGTEQALREPGDDEGTATQELRAIARERRRSLTAGGAAAAPGDRNDEDTSSITQVMRMSRDQRRERARQTTDAEPAAGRAATWRDGLFLAVVGLLFSAQFAFALIREGRVLVGLAIAVGPAALLFGVGVLVGRWLSREST